MRHYILLLVSGLSLALGACKKPGCLGDSMPDFLRGVLLDKTGHSLLTSLQTPIRVWAYNQQGRLFFITPSPDNYQPVFSADSTTAFPYRFMYKDLSPSVQSSSGTKDFYLELNGKVDTLHYDVRLARPNDCFDRYDVVEIRFNGQLLTPRAMPGGYPYYVLQRRH